MAKNVEEIRKEAEEATNEIVDEMQDVANDIKEDGKIKKFFKGIDWKKVGRDALLIAVGVGLKTAFDFGWSLGDKVDLSALDGAATPEVDTNKVVNF